MTRRLNTGAQAGNATYVAALALKQGTTWGTAAAVGAGLGIAVTSESIAGGEEPLDRQDLGFPFGQEIDVGAEMHRGAINADVHHGGNFGRLLSYFFGTSGAPTGSSNYIHTLTLAQSLDVFATIALAKRQGIQWWEYASAMATRFEVSGQGNERCKATVEWIATALNRASAVNDTTQYNAVTVPTRRGLAYAKQGTFRVNAQAGGALGSPVGTITTTDVVPIAGFRITGDRKLSTDFLVDGTNYPAQPAEDGEIDLGLEVDIRSYDAETWIAAYHARTEYKADLTLLSGYVPSAGSALYVKFNMPRIIVAEQPQAPITGRGRIPHKVKFKLLTPASAPTGMTVVTPLEAVVNDEVSTAYLT